MQHAVADKHESQEPFTFLHPRRGARPRAISRRRFLHLAGTVAAGTALAACTPLRRPPPKPRSGEKVNLVYQDWRTDWFPPMVQEMLEEFHASHPNIRVYYTLDPPSDTFEDRMLSLFESGTAPDVFQGCCAFFPIWAQKGYTLDLRSYVKTDLDQATIADWDPAQYNAYFTRDGQQYGLPKYHGALALYYNKDLLDKYGVTYPDDSWDHDDYLTAMKRLTRDRAVIAKPHWGSMLNISWDRIQVHVNGWGGHFVDPNDPTICRMAEPAAMQAVEWLRARMWNDKVMATPLDMQKMGTSEAFSAGRLAMVEDGSWALKAILTGADFRIGVAPMPAGPVRRATLASTDGFAIYKGTKYPDAAWELMKFLISKDYGRAMARAQFLQPARASLVDEWVSYIREEFPEKAKDVDIAAFAEGHLKGYSVIAETFANMAEASRLAGVAWDQILTLGELPVEHLQDVCKEIQEAQQG